MSSSTQLASLDFPLDAAGLGDQLLVKLDTLRAAAPIYWSEVNKAWIITGHAEVLEGYRGRLPLSSVRLPETAVSHIPLEQRQSLLPNLMEAFRGFIINMDEPEHRRIRRLLVRAFSGPVVESIRPHARRIIQETLDKAAAFVGPFDFCEEIARPIPTKLILKQFGLDDSMLPTVQRWSILNAMGATNTPLETLIEIEKVVIEMREICLSEIEKRRRNPTDDFISALVTANEDGDRLTEAEMIGTCVVTFIAGHDTTTNTIALGVAALARDPEASTRLHTHPELLPNAIMEIQRRVAMSTLMSRVVKEDFDWKGHALRKGDVVLLCQAAANRDPLIFPNPERLDFTRNQVPNMAFAPGVHYCIGHLFAKMTLGNFFSEFLRRFDFEVLTHDLNFTPYVAFRGLNSLPIRLKARRPRGPGTLILRS